MITVVAILTVRKAAAPQFQAYEKHAATVMKAHGGRIERTIAIPAADDVFKEVHIVTFPSAEAFAAYSADARLGDMKHVRDASVVDTQVLIGADGPSY